MSLSGSCARVPRGRTPGPDHHRCLPAIPAASGDARGCGRELALAAVSEILDVDHSVVCGYVHRGDDVACFIAHGRRESPAIDHRATRPRCGVEPLRHWSPDQGPRAEGSAFGNERLRTAPRGRWHGPRPRGRLRDARAGKQRVHRGNYYSSKVPLTRTDVVVARSATASADPGESASAPRRHADRRQEGGERWRHCFLAHA